MALCSEIELLVGAFQDGELEPREMQEVARHVAQCRDCETLLDDFAAVGRMVRAAAVEPSLEGFAEAVQKRIARLHVPILIRIQHYVDSLSHRLVAGLAMASTALAIAALTAVLVTPFVRGIVDRTAVANTPASTGAEKAPESMLASAAEDSHAVISRLETAMPSVAVWSEPQTETTVIWLPDEASE